MVSVFLPSDALSQHLPSYLGFSYLGRGVSLHGCSSKVQPLLLTLDEGYLLTATPPDLETTRLGTITFIWELYWWLGGKESTCNAGDMGNAGLIPGWRRYPGGGNGNSLQYSCLRNLMERSPVGFSLWGCKQSDKTEATEYKSILKINSV